MAGLCGHFVAMTHRMLRFLECTSLIGSSRSKLVAMTPQTTLVGV